MHIIKTAYNDNRCKQSFFLIELQWLEEYLEVTM